MGTRNLTMVVKDKKIKVAQYGQWDGYPSGQGVIVLNFLLSQEKNFDKFFEQLNKVKFIDDMKEKEIDEYLKSIGSKDGWLTMEQSAKYKKKYPLLTRDNGAEILRMILESKVNEKELWVNDSSDFVNDSLFCEWAYVIDFDKETFEIYTGFNHTPLGENERFYKKGYNGKKSSDTTYYPVKHYLTFKLDELPAEADFLKACKEKDEEIEKAEELVEIAKKRKLVKK